MWQGKITPELKNLYNEYYERFNSYPDEYIELEYGEDEYKDYVRDIKKALKIGKELIEFVE